TGEIDPMHPRSSPSPVVSVTNAPDGARKVSSYCAGSRSTRLPESTASIELRAMSRRVLRCSGVSIVLVPVDQHQVAGVNDEPRRLPDDKDRVTPMHRIDGSYDATGQRQVPEDDRDVADLPALGCDPLDDESRAEEKLTEESESHP